MLANRYRDLSIYRLNEGSGWNSSTGYELVGTFKGLIQTPAPSNIFNEGKESATIAAILFCDKNQTFTSDDIIVENGNGFKVTNSSLQTNGVCGLTPSAGQHAEYNLTYVQGGIV